LVGALLVAVGTIAIVAGFDMSSAVQASRTRLFRWLHRRNKLLALFYDAEYQELTTWLENHSVIKELQRTTKEFKYSDQQGGIISPFTIIRQHCEEAAKRVASGSITVAVHGGSVQDKSKLCNLLLDRQMIPGTCWRCFSNAQYRAALTLMASMVLVDGTNAVPFHIQSGACANQAHVYINSELDLRCVAQFNRATVPLGANVDCQLPEC
jgi:hypothetical protein